MKMLRLEVFLLFIISSFTSPSTSYLQRLNDNDPIETDPPPTFPSVNLDGSKSNKRQIHADEQVFKMAYDYEAERRISEALLSAENDLNFFDKLFNTRGRLMPHGRLTNRTKVHFNFPDGSNTTYLLCHLAAFLDFEFGGTSTADKTIFVREIASTLMAMRDFNTGNNSIIPQIKQCNGRVNLRFTMEFIDTRHQPLKVVAELTKIMQRRKQPERNAKDGVNVVQAIPSGIIGATRSSVTSPLSTLAGVNDLVTISHASTSSDFSLKNEYPLFGRTIPSNAADAATVVSFFREVLNATHLGVLHVNDPYGVSYARLIKNAAVKANVIGDGVALPIGASPEDAEKSLKVLKNKGIRYTVAILFEEEFEVVMPLAYEMGIAGDDHFWMFTDSLLDLTSSPLARRSDIQRAVHGSAIVAPSFGKDLLQGTRFYDEYTSRFSALWESGEGWNYLQSKLPHLNMTKNMIKGREPSLSELFLYEAVVALCLASCDAAEASYPSFFAGYELYESFTKTKFDGVYGPASFDKETGDPSVGSVDYAVYNILASENTLKIEAKYQLMSKEEREESYKTMIWEPVRDREFIYADGSATPPANLPPLEENDNGISTGIAVVSLCICGALLIFCVVCFVWTYKKRNTKVVRASQPFFLYILCVGSIILSSALIPEALLAFDLSQSGLNAACMCTPWLFSLGFVVSYSALFSKMKRVNTIMKKASTLKRVVVKPIDVMKPFFIMLAVNLALLIAWTIAAPLEYKRYPSSGVSLDTFGRRNSSYNSCYPPADKRTVKSYIFLLLLLISDLFVVFFLCFQAYSSRNITSEYDENEYISLTIYALFQILVIMIPVNLAMIGSPSTALIVFSLEVALIALAILLPLFGSKVLALQREKIQIQEKEKRKQERLERLRKFDALKNEQGNETSTPDSRAESFSSNAVIDHFNDDDDESENDEGYGFRVISHSWRESCTKIRIDLARLREENDQLSQEIISTQRSLDSALMKLNRAQNVDLSKARYSRPWESEKELYCTSVSLCAGSIPE